MAHASSPRRVAVLGSTGSIGQSALQVIAQLEGRLEVAGLAASTRWQALAEQARATGARRVALADAGLADHLRRALAGSAVEVLAGPEGVAALAAADDVDVVLSAVVGAAGLPVALAAAKAGKTLAIANKEPLVMAGPALLALAAEHGATILPVDSEHSAIFQALRGGLKAEVDRIIITASGGPFFDWPAERVFEATVAEALAHPTWAMGPKVTIDSATLMNKALEIVEARWLFDVEPDRIEVVIHPESIVHSVVAFRDGSALAQLSVPDMRTPIQYALTYPERLPGLAAPLDLAAVGRLRFIEPDRVRFPALSLGFSVAREGGVSGAVLNAANEAAVALFLQRRIPFGRITEVVADVLDRHAAVANPDLEAILAADRWAREEVFASCSSQS